MKKTFISISIITTLVLLSDVFIGFIGRELLKKCDPSSFYGEINYSITELEADGVILGASRAKSHYVPTILMDSLDMSVYNSGCDGRNILYSTCVGNAIIERSKPKFIILELAYFEFQWKAIDRVSILNPYYKQDSLIRATVNMKSSTEYIKMMSNLYRYNSIFVMMVKNIFSKDSSKSFGFRKGFGTDEYMKRNELNLGDEIEEESIERFKWFIHLCKKNNVNLIVCMSPSYVKVIEEPKTITIIDEICKEEDIPFLNYLLHDSFINDRTLYKDAMHLNTKGAEIFTKTIIKDIKEHI